MIDLKEIKKEMNIHEKELSVYATKNAAAERLFKEEAFDIRSAFFKDIDRILYSLSYNRYMDKTQVFSMVNNDHISKRMVHVQLVSKIARTIGRALKLNEDLIEAIALGHDLGHVPFGHLGEEYLNELSLKHHEGYFNHNVQSVRTLMNIEKNGEGNNLCLQTLDGIMCHNGEMPQKEFYPKCKTWQEFLDEYAKTYEDKEITKHLNPMTLEGCVVRISDIIGYIGRDIEDAIKLGVIKQADLPKEITEVLGSNNRSIINTIILDIVTNSYNKNYLMMSEEVYNALIALKNFNYKFIYDKANTAEQKANYRKMFERLFAVLLKEVEENNQESNIYLVYLNNMNHKYISDTSHVRKVIDYIAGMTDDYFVNEYKIYYKD